MPLVSAVAAKVRENFERALGRADNVDEEVLVPPQYLVARAQWIALPLCLVAMTVAVGTAWSQPSLAREDFPVEMPSGLSLNTTVSDRPADDPKVLLGPGERWRLVNFGVVATAAPLDAKMSAFGQGADYRAADALAPAVEDAYRPTFLRVTGEMAEFEMGAEYRALGKRLEPVVSVGPSRHDQEGSEVWLARRLGPLRLRLSQSDLTDNVDANPLLPRTTRSQSAVTAELAMSSWPRLGLTYAAGDSERVRPTTPGRDGPPQRQRFESLTGSAYYFAGRWDVTSSLTYAQGRDAGGAQDETETVSYDVSLSLRPADAVTVVPAVSIGSDRNETSGVRWDTATASLTLSYTPRRPWHAWTAVVYTTAGTTDGSVGGRGVSMNGGLGWDLGRLLGWRSALSIEGGYDQYLDTVAPEGSSRGVFGFLLLKVGGF